MNTAECFIAHARHASLRDAEQSCTCRGCEILESANSNRNQAVLIGPVAKRIRPVVAPTVRRSIRGNTTGMETTSAHAGESKPACHGHQSRADTC